MRRFLEWFFRNLPWLGLLAAAYLLALWTWIATHKV